MTAPIAGEDLEEIYKKLKISRGVWKGFCEVCKQKFKKNTMIYVVDHPSYSVMHQHCVPYLQDYSSYPHPFPLSFYYALNMTIKIPNVQPPVLPK